MSTKTRYFMAISGAILAIGLGTGLVASYMGLPVSVFSSAAGPDELQYVPADAAVVAYANVRDVMNSEFRKRFKDAGPTQDEKNQFEEKTGLNLEEDIDSVVVAVNGNVVNDREKGFLVLGRGRYDAARLEALALEHGAEVTDYQGKRLITHRDDNASGDPRHAGVAVGFVEADLVAFGSLDMVRKSIDARQGNNVLSNIEMMKLVNELDNANAWAVGRFDAIASQANLPSEIQAQLPQITWFSAAGHLNGGVSGQFKAEARDEESAKNLRDVLSGFLAMARMHAASKPALQQLADSLIVSGDGTNVALSFSIPTEVLDILEGLAKSRQGVQQ